MHDSATLYNLKSELEASDIVQIRNISPTDLSDAIWKSYLDRQPLHETEDDDDDPDAVDTVAQGSPATSVFDHSLPVSTTTTKEAVLDTQRLPAKSMRLFTASRSFNALPTSESRAKEGLSRTKSLSAILPLKAQRQVFAALGMVSEEEE